MNELSIRLSVLNSKTFATKVIADIVSNGSKVKTYEQRLFNQISQPNIKRMAEDIKKLIDTNLKQGLKYTGGKVAPLAEATIEAKKRKGRRQPDRVFLDSGILFQSLRLVPIAKGFAVTFKKIKYPKSKLSVMEVAQWLNDGTPKMPARPFFGITELQLNKIISRHADARRITVEPTPRQVEQAGQAIKLITGFDPLKVQVIKSEGLKAATVQTEKLAVQEVVTTAPKVAEFVPAKTVQEAEERIKNLGIPEVSLKGLKPDDLNGALKALESEHKKSPLKIKGVEARKYANPNNPYAPASYSDSTKKIFLSTREIPKYTDGINFVKWEDSVQRLKRQIKEWKVKYMMRQDVDQNKVMRQIRTWEYSISDLERKINSGEKQKFQNVTCMIEKRFDKIKSLIEHEIGHHRMFEFKHEDKFTKWTARHVTDYANSMKEEYYAEWYAYYRHFGDKDVPEDLLKLFKEIDNAK